MKLDLEFTFPFPIYYTYQWNGITLPMIASKYVSEDVDGPVVVIILELLINSNEIELGDTITLKWNNYDPLSEPNVDFAYEVRIFEKKEGGSWRQIDTVRNYLFCIVEPIQSGIFYYKIEQWTIGVTAPWTAREVIMYVEKAISEPIVVKSTGENSYSEWTIMAYFSGEVGYEETDWFKTEIDEMRQIGSTDKINIVYQIDEYNIGAYRSNIKKSYDESEEFEILGNINMATTNALNDFITWAQNNYPANNYALILGGHGSGAMMPTGERGGCCQDILIDGKKDFLTDIEILNAIEGKRIDLLVFHSCLMASFEFYYTLKNHVSIIVGSEDSLYYTAFPYNVILEKANQEQNLNANKFGNIIATEFINDENIQLFGGTCSVVDTSLLQDIFNKLDELSSQLSNNIEFIKDKIDDIRFDDFFNANDIYVQAYELNNHPYIDLCDFALLIIQTIDIQSICLAAYSLIGAIHSAVITNFYLTTQMTHYSIDGSNGLTIYFPEEYYSYFQVYRGYTFCKINSWDDFLDIYYQL